MKGLIRNEFEEDLVRAIAWGRIIGQAIVGLFVLCILIAALLVSLVGCVPSKPPKPPGPVPTPCACGMPAPCPPCPVPDPIPDPTPVTCPADAPKVNRYVVKCRTKAGPDNRFCETTPKVHDLAYCDPDADCPYKGGEGSKLRLVCEEALALTVWVLGKQREDNPFSADVPTGTAYKVCRQGFAGPVEPCAEGVAQ